MWFILMMIGLYICIPMMKQIATPKVLRRYFLGITFIVAFAFPELVSLSNDLIGGTFANGINHVNDTLLISEISEVMRYPFYFILGYELSIAEIGSSLRRIICFLSLIGFIATIVLSSYISVKTQTPTEDYYLNYNVNVLFEGIGVFVLFKYLLYKEHGRITDVWVRKLSDYSFGAYLVHVAIRNYLKVVGIDNLVIHPIVSVPVIAIGISIVAFFISMIINHIPLLNKWIV